MKPERPTVVPILQESRTKLQRRGFDENVHGETADQGRGPVEERRDRYADMGAGIWRWVFWSLCGFCLFVTILLASK